MKIDVSAGGLIGLETLMDACATRPYTHNGGWITLHDKGWTRFTPRQRKLVAHAIGNAPVIAEIGFGKGEHHDVAIAERVRTNYFDVGLNVKYIVSNCFAKSVFGDDLTVERWHSFLQDFEWTDVPVLPVFEVANRLSNKDKLKKMWVSKQGDYQKIIRSGKGIAVDTAGKYFFWREETYRGWVVDAIHWTKNVAKLPVVLIASPYTSQREFEEHTIKMLDYLGKRNALPDVINVENYYILRKDQEYVTVVGAWWIDDTCIGLGYHLLMNYLQGKKDAV